MACRVLIGLTGNLIVAGEKIYYDDAQTIWNPSEFTEGALKPARSFIDGCEPFEYGGMHYTAEATYDYKDRPNEETIIVMFYKQFYSYDEHYRIDDNGLFWMRDNTVYRLALDYKDKKIIRLPGPLISKINDRIRWTYNITCPVSVSLKGKLLDADSQHHRLLYVNGSFFGEMGRVALMSRGLCELPDFTLVLNLKLVKIDDILHVERIKKQWSVYKLVGVKLPENYIFICPPNTGTIYLIDMDTGEKQLCQFILYEVFGDMLRSEGFELLRKPNVANKYKTTYIRRGLCVHVGTDQGYECEYERSAGMGKYTKLALRE